MNSLISKKISKICYWIWTTFLISVHTLPHHQQLAKHICFLQYIYFFYKWFSWVRKWCHKLLQMNSFMFCSRQHKTKIAYRWIQKRDNYHHPMSTNPICEHNINIPDILFLRSFNLNSTCSARGNVSYMFFFLRDKHTTFYGRLHVLYVSTIW